ncbi:hypothetical protein [Hirschia litorea]|uniref:EF-hand domain-containing protein n=1 Tax=Hirschia litorea TaxID=1199156 RepID=A0ABW2IMI5_9PROT
MKTVSKTALFTASLAALSTLMLDSTRMAVAQAAPDAPLQDQVLQTEPDRIAPPETVETAQAETQDTNDTIEAPDPPPPEASTGSVELIPQRVVGRGRDLRGIRIAKPAALLFASFDDDHSLSVTIAEIEANAEAAFARADTSKNGTLSIFEQQDWAEAVGSHDGPLANAVTFDTNIDRQVTLEEFKAGLIRLANSYMTSDETEIQFASMLINPNGKAQKGSKDSHPLRDEEQPKSHN